MDGEKRVTSKPCFPAACEGARFPFVCHVLSRLLHERRDCTRVVVVVLVRFFRGGKAGNRETKAQVGKVSWVKVGRRQGPGKARSSGCCWGVPRKCQVPRRSLEAGANQTKGRLGAKTLKTFTTRPSWVALLALLPCCCCSPQSLARHQPSIRLSKKPGPRPQPPSTVYRLPSCFFPGPWTRPPH